MHLVWSILFFDIDARAPSLLFITAFESTERSAAHPLRIRILPKRLSEPSNVHEMTLRPRSQREIYLR
jgi:hypothetical protein